MRKGPCVQAQGHHGDALLYRFISISNYSLFSPLYLPSPLLLQDVMENKAMYLHATVSDRDSSSIFEEPFDGRSLSKLNLCEDGECRGLGLGCEVSPARPHPPTPPHTAA